MKSFLIFLFVVLLLPIIGVSQEAFREGDDQFNFFDRQIVENLAQVCPKRNNYFSSSISRKDFDAVLNYPSMKQVRQRMSELTNELPSGINPQGFFVYEYTSSQLKDSIFDLLTNYGPILSKKEKRVLFENFFLKPFSNAKKNSQRQSILDEIQERTQENIKRLVNMLWVEIVFKPGWSLKDYSPEEVEIILEPIMKETFFFKSLPKDDLFYPHTSCHSNSSTMPFCKIRYYPQTYSKNMLNDTYSPYDNYRFLPLAIKLLGNNCSQEGAIELFVEWTAWNFIHYYSNGKEENWGLDNYLKYDVTTDEKWNHKQNNVQGPLLYKKYLTLDDIFQERIGGCRIPSITAVHLANSLNIPAMLVEVETDKSILSPQESFESHGAAYFVHEDKMIHGDWLATLAFIDGKDFLLTKEEFAKEHFDSNGKYSSYSLYPKKIYQKHDLQIGTQGMRMDSSLYHSLTYNFASQKARDFLKKSFPQHNTSCPPGETFPRKSSNPTDCTTKPIENKIRSLEEIAEVRQDCQTQSDCDQGETCARGYCLAFNGRGACPDWLDHHPSPRSGLKSECEINHKACISSIAKPLPQNVLFYCAPGYTCVNQGDHSACVACVDSENGADHFKKGEVKYKGVTYADHCAYEIDSFSKKLEPLLVEYSCDKEDNLITQSFRCSCFDGYCQDNRTRP